MPTAPPLSDLLPPEHIVVGLDVATREEVVGALVRAVAADGAVVDAERLEADVLAREAMMSTGVGHGVALPHARSAATSGTVAALATLGRPVDFASFDGEPVEIAVLLAGPEAERGGHVRLLSRLSLLLSDVDLRRRLREAATPAEAAAALRDAEAVAS
ncbi:PTS sugar transporter subunit IIA [Rubrivirga sp. S365]|uniref:PTS sugar transporter subunit IIA n=1 Tax=Rubrivirga litoralis TaxID=3075598 RepID=A0ABU3BUT3_9BACT|nr:MULTISPECIES: PTS sugar transporter subunit IIA [unclassified Rubrivirga]MDT0633054.1 PTS sugar transporter subunit IIA [Rubrivirga sp. F394]MDT7857121.1 PTS sugar transporter subunit IIA [Rubrivirga sp. S365]